MFAVVGIVPAVNKYRGRWNKHMVREFTSSVKNIVHRWLSLVFLKRKISKILDNDGDMLDASKIDQSKFHYLKNHESIR